MGKSQIPVVKRSLFSWIFYKNTKLQLLLVGVILITVVTRVLPLEMQKRIVNEAIFLRDVDMLWVYCGLYFVFVVLSSVLKYVINIIQTLISQKATANMRKELYHHILTLPLFFFRSTAPGTIVNALISELTIPGNFVGMSIAIPVSNLLTLIAFALYLFWLNSYLACVTLLIYPFVLFLLPLLQRKVNKANKKRVQISRVLSSKIAESVSGIHEIQSNGAFDIENNKFDAIVEKLLGVRITWSLYRFGVKTMNNFFTSLGPFLVFLLGGYLTIRGSLELGALVAFLSAQEKLYDPWRELIEFYQVYQEGRINYDRTMESFDVLPQHAIHSENGSCQILNNDIVIQNLSFSTSDGIQLLNDISFDLRKGEHLALVGFSGSGKSTLAQCIGQLYKYTGGNAKIGGKEVSDLSKMDISANTGFVSQNPFIFDGTIEDNLLYATRAIEAENGLCREDGAVTTLDDMISVIQRTGIFIDVLKFGLNTIIEHDQRKNLVADVLTARKTLKAQYDEKFKEWVEFYTEEKYLEFSSIAENIMFGAPYKDSFKEENLIYNSFFIQFIKKNSLEEPLFNLGKSLCLSAVDILKNLPKEELFFKQSPIHPHEFDSYQHIASLLGKKESADLSKDVRRKVLNLALRFSPGRHKIVTLKKQLKSQILKGRPVFKATILQKMEGAITFYHMDQYFHSQTILNNILFGNTKITNPEIHEEIHRFIVRILIEEDMLEKIVEIGMQYRVGTKGDNLSGGQRQKLAIARALLKKPKILILDEATSALDNKSQARIQNHIEHQLKGKSTLIAVVHRLDILKSFDKIAVMKAGKVSEVGSYEELMKKKGVLYELEFGKR